MTMQILPYRDTWGQAWRIVDVNGTLECPYTFRDEAAAKEFLDAFEAIASNRDPYDGLSFAELVTRYIAEDEEHYSIDFGDNDWDSVVHSRATFEQTLSWLLTTPILTQADAIAAARFIEFETKEGDWQEETATIFASLKCYLEGQA
jgi:hypothetical protein